MELLNPTSLWKDFDRKRDPLDVSVVSVRTENAVVTERLYFSGLRAADGVQRVYARLIYPQNCTFKLIAVTMDEYDRPADAFRLTPQDRDSAVLVVDYAGLAETERYTLYPPSLRYAQPAGRPDTFTALPEDPHATCWYVWTATFLRAVAYMEERFPAASLLFLGVGTGCAQAVKAAALAAPAGVLLIGTDRADSADLAFKASLSGDSYLPKITAPVLQLCGSNARGNAAERVTEAFRDAPDHMRLFIRPRGFGRLNAADLDTIKQFLVGIKTGNTLPAAPSVRPHASDGHLYCDVSAPGADSVQLYSAQSSAKDFLRNWHRVPAESAGEIELARVSVYNVNDRVLLLAVARYGAFTFSSPVVAVSPAAIGVIPDTLSRIRMLYDAENGVDDWQTDEGEPAHMTLGALGIRGVAGDKTLITFKPGDCVYAAAPGDVLQTLVYSAAKQTVVFTAVDSSGARFSCARTVDPFAGWTKFTFSAGDFKSKDGTLPDWASAVCLSLTAETEVVVNSLLWV